MQGRLVAPCRRLRLPALEPLSEACDARLELGALDQALSVAVDQPPHAAAQLADLRLDGHEIRTGGATLASRLEAPLIFRRDPPRVAQQPLDLGPDRRIEPVGADLRVRAHALAAEPVGVAAAAPVIGVSPPLALRRAQADRLAIVGVSALPADGEALQQVTLAAATPPVATPVLRQLLLDGL